jgi:hypothetical protein
MEITNEIRILGSRNRLAILRKSDLLIVRNLLGVRTSLFDRISQNTKCRYPWKGGIPLQDFNGFYQK